MASSVSEIRATEASTASIQRRFQSERVWSIVALLWSWEPAKNHAVIWVTGIQYVSREERTIPLS